MTPDSLLEIERRIAQGMGLGHGLAEELLKAFYAARKAAGDGERNVVSWLHSLTPMDEGIFDEIANRIEAGEARDYVANCKAKGIEP
jgi:hypothetical protein